MNEKRKVEYEQKYKTENFEIYQKEYSTSGESNVKSSGILEFTHFLSFSLKQYLLYIFI